jgi:SAM-dependent methyltransferase
LYADYLEIALRRYQPQQSLRMLDIGPAPVLGKFIDGHAQITRVTSDLYAEGVDYRLDITDMHAFADASFDLLICSHVLEHIPDDRKALKELYRVLKHGGWGIVMVPICMAIDAIDEDPTVTDVGERWRRFGQDDHIRLHNRFGFVERVESAGFVVRPPICSTLVNGHFCGMHSRHRLCCILSRKHKYTRPIESLLYGSQLVREERIELST